MLLLRARLAKVGIGPRHRYEVLSRAPALLFQTPTRVALEVRHQQQTPHQPYSKEARYDHLETIEPDFSPKIPWLSSLRNFAWGAKSSDQPLLSSNTYPCPETGDTHSMCLVSNAISKAVVLLVLHSSRVAMCPAIHFCAAAWSVVDELHAFLRWIRRAYFRAY
jgi:hypothetical protein